MSPGLEQYRIKVGRLICCIFCIMIITGCNTHLIKPMPSTPSAHTKAPVAKATPAPTFGPPAPIKTAPSQAVKSVGATIQGVVTDIDHPVKGITIEMDIAEGSLFSKTTQTDEKGFFAFPNVAPGSYFLMMTISLQQHACRVMQVAKVEKNATVKVNFTFPGTIYMQGQFALLPDGSLVRCQL